MLTVSSVPTANEARAAGCGEFSVARNASVPHGSCGGDGLHPLDPEPPMASPISFCLVLDDSPAPQSA